MRWSVVRASNFRTRLNEARCAETVLQQCDWGLSSCVVGASSAQQPQATSFPGQRSSPNDPHVIRYEISASTWPQAVAGAPQDKLLSGKTRPEHARCCPGARSAGSSASNQVLSV
mmetsp:Transcript_103834/g.293643  ORF Transcript_103834/g.293643 Transcript_103834/m.293643 type:complete len:115 (+) Transcript_103834:247-591(+)